jgi:hypothetical protein
MSEQRYPRHVAEDFLREILPANARDVEERARAAGIAQRTLARARQRLGVTAQRDGRWRLPDENENSEGSHLPDPDLTCDGTPLAEKGNSADLSPEPVAETPAAQNESAPHELRLCDHCGEPSTADDPVRHGYWRANRPSGSWLHAGCVHPYQAAAGWRK